MTTFFMTSFHVDLNEADKCVDIIPLTLLASLLHLRTLVQNTNGDHIWPNLRRFINQFMKVGGIRTWKELTIGVQQVVRLLFNNNFIKKAGLYCIWLAKLNTESKKLSVVAAL